MRKFSVFLGLVLALVMVPLASAGEVMDPDDSASKLDIEYLKVEAKGPATLGVVNIRTYGKWRSRFLKDAKPTSLRVLFDEGHNGSADMKGEFRYKEGKLWFFMEGTKTGNKYDPIRATRPNRRTVRVVFYTEVMEFGDFESHVWAWAKSIDAASPPCMDVTCRDRAPNGGAVKVF